MAALASVLIAGMALWGLRMYLDARYPAKTSQPEDLSARVAKLEGQVSTLELQRGIVRKIHGT